MRDRSLAIIMVATRVIADTTHTAGRISIGLAEPFLRRSAATVVGISWREAVFITTNKTMLSFADDVVFVLCLGCCTCFRSCSSSNSFIAAIPKGVEALPSPSRFAVRFRTMYCMALLLGLSPLKRRLRRGVSAVASNAVIPAFWAMRITPDHRQIAPASPSARVTALLLSRNAASETPPMLPEIAAKVIDDSISIQKTHLTIVPPVQGYACMGCPYYWGVINGTGKRVPTRSPLSLRDIPPLGGGRRYRAGNVWAQRARQAAFLLAGCTDAMYGVPTRPPRQPAAATPPRVGMVLW